MSAAPSDLSWDTWSASFLDHDNPVLQGQDKCSIPEFWKGSALFWSQCSSAESLNGSNVVVVHPGHQIVCSDNDVYSVGGVSQQEVLNNKGIPYMDITHGIVLSVVPLYLMHGVIPFIVPLYLII